MKKIDKLSRSFFQRDVLEVAPQLIGKLIVRKFEDGHIERYRITETEAYREEEDLACHARKGRTPRTEIMYREGSKIYIYLIYGMHWMMNIVTSVEGSPQAVLIRGIEGIYGPGKLTKSLQIDKSFNGEDITISGRIWIEDDGYVTKYSENKRIGIDYAGEWKDKKWRYTSMIK
jgi:DNA-3-methyladenine glycosylase